MTQYRLHYAGSTFDLRDENEAETLLAKVKSVAGNRVNAVVTVNLVEGVLHLALSRNIAVAVSTVTPEDDVAAPSVYETRDPLVV